MWSYLWWSTERTKVISAEWCMNTLDGELTNYVFFALTSKTLKTWNNFVSPNFYNIYLSSWDTNTLTIDNKYNSTDIQNSRCQIQKVDTWYIISDNKCNEIILAYQTWNNISGNLSSTIQYKAISSDKNCRQNNWTELRFYWLNFTWENSQATTGKMISMNKWFVPFSIAIEDQKPFYTMWQNVNERFIYWEILIRFCIDWKNCKWEKDVWKRIIDARSQTITLKKCRFYYDDYPTICEERAN